MAKTKSPPAFVRFEQTSIAPHVARVMQRSPGVHDIVGAAQIKHGGRLNGEPAVRQIPTEERLRRLGALGVYVRRGDVLGPQPCGGAARLCRRLSAALRDDRPLLRGLVGSTPRAQGVWAMKGDHATLIVVHCSAVTEAQDIASR